jgi:hypothetical protein
VGEGEEIGWTLYKGLLIAKKNYVTELRNVCRVSVYKVDRAYAF